MTEKTSRDLRIVFAGTPAFAAHYLEFLLATNHQIVGVYSQPDRPAGRGKKLQQSPVKQLALENDLCVFQPVNFKQADSINELAELKPDLMIVVAYGLILPQAILDLPTYGCINIHASLLPRWRGAAPIQRAIEAGDAETGITIMQMDAGLDTGDMLTTSVCNIERRDTAASLHDKLVEAGKPALTRALDNIACNQTNRQKQNDAQANYAAKIEKAEAEIDWQLAAPILDRKIRAFNPFPVCFSYLGDQRIKIHNAFVLENHSQGEPGEIMQINNQGIDVQAGKGTIRIEKLQMPGKKALACNEVLRGYPGLFTVGNQFDALTEKEN